MNRRGVTLLEVVFAIGIAAIGILGVMMTIVLAGRQARDGADADAADRVGRSAIRAFDARAMGHASGPAGTWAEVAVSGTAYCLDPLYVATNGTSSPGCWFPAFDPAVVPGVRLRRISLRAFPGNQAMAPVPPIGFAAAEALFCSRDDLVFSLPDDRTLPPVQLQSSAGSRQFEGAFTWFATVCAPNYGSGAGSVSVVVCQRRDLTEPDILLTVAKLDWPMCNLAVRSGRPDDDLGIKEHRWIFLAGSDVAGIARHGWYRVVNRADILPAGQPDIDGTVYPTSTRWVTLFGQDWRCNAATTQAGVVGPVVAVYEKTFRVNGD